MQVEGQGFYQSPEQSIKNISVRLIQIVLIEHLSDVSEAMV